MKIIFNLMNCGLGNQGGSQTLVLSANTLSQLGHEVYIIDSGRSQYTWDKIEVPHIVPKNNNNIPDADVIIATGYRTFKSTVKLPNRCGKKFSWLRAWETWVYSEKQIIEKILKAPVIHIVNSISLQNKLKSHGFDSNIIRPGNDFKFFKPSKVRGSIMTTIGGLYNIRHKSKRSDWITKTFQELNKENKLIKLWLMGTERKPNIDIPFKYWRQPDKSSKEKFYQGCDILISPTENEGLHIVPQEAMLTECPVIGTSAPLSGMKDYLIHKETGLVAGGNTLKSFINQAKILSKDKNLRKKLGKAGRKKILKLGSRKDNMKKLIELLETKI